MTSLAQAHPSPRHGGDLSVAIKHYGGHAKNWLDLSTGVNPCGYPIPDLDTELWRTLPDNPTDLIRVAANYYGCTEQAIELTPGSQLAIRLLPTLIESPSSVAIPELGYQEHAHAWSRAGHTIELYQNLTQLDQLIHQQRVEHAVIINPNNPSCEIVEPAVLRKISIEIDGLLVLDEAFADLNPDTSLCPRIGDDHEGVDNLVIFRSVGKFFGLAGARVGFIISQNEIGRKLGNLLAPWPVNAAAQKVTECALGDQQWQVSQRRKILTRSAELARLLEMTLCPQGLSISVKSQGLFTTIFGHNNDLISLHTQLAKQRIWTRLGDTNSQQQNWLRLSLPGNNFATFENALNSLTL